MDAPAPRAARSGFPWLVGASQLVGLAAVVLTGVWMGHYRGGFAWDGSARQFNVHPLCMVLGLVFLQGDGESLRFTAGQSGKPTGSCLLSPDHQGATPLGAPTRGT
ncbi:Cytochrome b561 [Liparis tanakae]|uniref:Cytochrome b561 n=1 Tax=Liparis tanakae TaxID=230148 RepID=A0A4Z2E8W0_9TELE|nr:Cytochrome b561 [Liparis tanakae]